MFAYGLAGIFATLKPFNKDQDLQKILSILALLVGVFTFAILPITNALAFDYKQIVSSPLLSIVISLSGIYLCLII